MKNKNKKKEAIALRYNPKSAAPRIIAKGKGPVAEKIIALAKQHNIVMYDDPDLVAILSQLELQKEIPPTVYKVVAEIFAFVYSINKKFK